MNTKALERKSGCDDTAKPVVATKVYKVGANIEAFYENRSGNGKWYRAVIKYKPYPKKCFDGYNADGSTKYETYMWDYGIVYEDGEKVYGINATSKRTGRPKIRFRMS